jgi:hypothetical protein
MTQDYRRDPTPEEAYNLQYGMGDDEYLRGLRAEVKTSDLRELSQQPQPAGPASHSYQPTDCVVTNPSVLTGWDIKKVGCNSNPGAGLILQKVVSLQNGSSGQCDLGLTTFQDDPKGETYCLEDTLSGNG